MRGLLFILVFIIFIPAQLDAAPPPNEVKEIKERAPVHLIGEVKEDHLLQDTTDERGYPSQIREMKLKVNEIIKGTDDVTLHEDIVSISYSYVPSWVPMAGGAKMDIMVGDQIEIWLKLGENGFEPALGGNTVNHLSYIESRVEPIPEPFPHKLQRYYYENREYVIFAGLLIFSLLIIIIWKIKRQNVKPIKWS